MEVLVFQPLNVFPREIWLKIFSLLDTPNLLQAASVCRTFYDMIHTSNTIEERRLWRMVYTEYAEHYIAESHNLDTLFRHSHIFEDLNLSQFACTLDALVLTTRINQSACFSCRLSALDFTGLQIYNLDFLRMCTGLTHLTLSHCIFIPDVHFNEISHLTKLEFLNLGFTGINPRTLVSVVKSPLFNLDVPGVKLSVKHVKKIVDKVQSLHFLYMSLRHGDRQSYDEWVNTAVVDVILSVF